MTDPNAAAKKRIDWACLTWLAKQSRWSTYRTDGHGMPTLADAGPEVAALNEKQRLAVMNRLIRRKLVDGCTCGCRGDFEITDAGEAFINEAFAKARKEEPPSLLK